jgi:RNA polymerase sigma factor (sigma-70 family)
MLRMFDNMAPADHSSLATRASLLARLKSGDDSQSWLEFYRTYGGLIRSFAANAGLNTDEAEEVLQETAIGVARRLPDFIYSPEVCRFKTWLLNLVRWRIQDQLRKRVRHPSARHAGLSLHRSGSPDDGSRTATVNRIADPTVPEFGRQWDLAWEQNGFQLALEQLRHEIDE